MKISLSTFNIIALSTAANLSMATASGKLRGQPTDEDQSRNLIIGGTQADVGQYPYYGKSFLQLSSTWYALSFITLECPHPIRPLTFFLSFLNFIGTCICDHVTHSMKTFQRACVTPPTIQNLVV